MLDLAAAEVELALIDIRIHATWFQQEEMFDVRTACLGNLAQRINIDRNFSPANAGNPPSVSHFGDDLFDDLSRIFVVARKEKYRNAEICLILKNAAELFSCLAEKRVGDLS
jgi:hypothetical protein